MLSDYVIEKRSVTYRDKVLVEVRGLNYGDFCILVRNHLDEIGMVWAATSDGKLLPEKLDITVLAFALATKSPDTAATLIALASDEPDGAEAARRLSMPLTIKIIIEVFKLTLEDVGGPLAFRELLAQAAAAEMLESRTPTVQ